MKKWITGVVFACAGYAQPPVMTPEQIIAYLARDLRGVPFPGAASGISAEDLNRARLAGERREQTGIPSSRRPDPRDPH